MKIKEIYPGLYKITLKSQYLTAMTFMRVQEYYESRYPSIKGKYFPIEDFMDIYSEKNGNFTYTLDWGGFNIPGNIYMEWAEDFWKYPDMMQKEINLYDKLLPIIKKRKKKFYIISAMNQDDLNHEIAHGLYYLNKKYKKEMDSLINPRTNFYKNFKIELQLMEYSDDVIKDEIQAYCSTQSYESLVNDDFINKHGNKNNTVLVKKFQDVFVKYTKNIK